jgi:hypothetical protein
MRKKLLVLGNGPSLKDYPFHKYNLDTVGMNLAYRYWESDRDLKGWYPTYYCCLDVNLTLQFHLDIYRLVTTTNIKKFFLRAEILKFHPDLRENEKVVFDTDVDENTKGFSKDRSKTTGGWAVRFGIFLGYDKIYLLGIDCEYTPTRDKDDNIVPIDRNKDYFFDGYWKEGDKVHVPSSSKKDKRKIHVEAFRSIAKEIKSSKVKIINCNDKSKLYTERVFPYSSDGLAKYLG